MLKWLFMPMFGPLTAAKIMREIENLDDVEETMNSIHPHDRKTMIAVIKLHLRERIWKILRAG